MESTVAVIVPPQTSLAFLVSSTAPPRDPPQVLKLAKKAAKRKQIKRGVKEVIKAIRKAHKGVVIIAGDISPIDVITPLPVLCEDADIPYIYVPSKEELGAAGCVGRTGWVCLGTDIWDEWRGVWDWIVPRQSLAWRLDRSLAESDDFELFLN